MAKWNRWWCWRWGGQVKTGSPALQCVPISPFFTRGLLSQRQDTGISFYCLPYISTICIFRFRIKQSTFHALLWIDVGLMTGTVTSPWQTATQCPLVCMPIGWRMNPALFDATNASYFSLLYVCVCVCVCVCECVCFGKSVVKIHTKHTHTYTSKFYLYKYNLFIQIKFLSRKIYDIKMTNIDIFRTINYENHI